MASSQSLLSEKACREQSERVNLPLSLTASTHLKILWLSRLISFAPSAARELYPLALSSESSVLAMRSVEERSKEETKR